MAVSHCNSSVSFAYKSINLISMTKLKLTIAALCFLCSFLVASPSRAGVGKENIVYSSANDNLRSTYNDEDNLKSYDESAAVVKSSESETRLPINGGVALLLIIGGAYGVTVLIESIKRLKLQR
jgi:hypothetical protein